MIWPISTLAPGETAEGRKNLFYDGNFEASTPHELPGNRILAAVAFSFFGWAPRYDVLDARTGRRLTSLDAQSLNTQHMSFPEVSRAGMYLAAYGNSLHMWETASGRRLLSLQDPAWAKTLPPGKWTGPFNVLFAPDEKQIVVLVEDTRTSRQRAFVYALPTGRRVTSFPLTAR
ncbi:hypothetical protein [Deinococcus apachensis]|uniref:hypothetical protein n=1 Tax=Deinococcus apachensis TaxID=309886 RepID=UPI00036F34B0|nr:hypothetical protein [Deinococcus apachensis]